MWNKVFCRMYGLAIIDILSLSGPGRSGYLSTFKGIPPIYIHMIFDVQKKITIFHHLETEIGMILRHKLGETSFQTNWFDNIRHSAEFLFHCNCNDKYWKTFFSLRLLKYNFSVQQFPLLKEEKKYFLTIVRPFPYGKEK